MNIVATTRTRNEEKNIERWCEDYQWADCLLIADGGSKDQTVEIANTMPKTYVRNFTEKVYSSNRKLWRNPHGKHINFIISQARGLCGNWIIFDDCDCFPTKQLQQHARALIETADESGFEAIMLYRIYFYGQDRYFPDMNEPGQSLWAWKLSSLIFASEIDPWHHTMVNIDSVKSLKLPKPYSCLHKFCSDPETTQAKLDFYRDSGQNPNIIHPLDSCGKLLPIEDWMVD